MSNVRPVTGVGTDRLAPNLLACSDGAVGQLAAGHAGREAEVVLDPHAAAGLAPGRRALEHHGVQPLGGAVDSRGQSRRPGPDDGQVVHRLLQRPADAEGVRQLAVRGVAQEQLVTPGDDGRVGLGHSELLEQLLHLRVGLQVQPGEQHPVLGQEVADPEGVLRVARPDHAQAREVPRLAEELPAGDERLKDDVAQVGVPFRSSRRASAEISKTSQSPRATPLTIAGPPVRCDTSPVNSPGPRTVDDLRRLAGIVQDLDRAGLDDEELEVAVADLEELFVRPDIV